VRRRNCACHVPQRVVTPFAHVRQDGADVTFHGGVSGAAAIEQAGALLGTLRHPAAR
jgi:hypothetical protein